MSFGVSDGRDFEYNGASASGLFANRGHLVKPRFHRMLLEHGADPTIRDGSFDATAAGWAEHAGHAGLAEWLRAREG